MKKSKLLSLVTIFSSLTNNTGPTIIVTKNSKILFYLYMLCMQSMYYFSRANNLNLNLCSLIKIGELDSCIPIGALCNYKSSFNIYSSIVFITEVDCLKIPEHAKYDPLQSASFIYLYEPEKFTIDLIQKIKDCNNNKQKVVLAFSNDPSPQHRYIAELELHNTLAIDRAQAIGKKYISPRIIDPLSASFNLQNIESAIDNIIPFLNKLTPTGSTLGKTKGIIICEDDSIVHKFINKLLSIKHCVFINTNEFNKSQCPNSILLIAKSDYIHTSSTLAQWVFIAANPNDALIIDQAYKLFNYIEQTICYVITFNFEAVEDFAKYNDKIAFDMANQDFIENYTKNHEIVLNMSNPSKSRTMIAI